MKPSIVDRYFDRPPVVTGSREHMQRARDDLDQARDDFALAQSRLIGAERRYNEASRAWEREYFKDVKK